MKRFASFEAVLLSVLLSCACSVDQKSKADDSAAQGEIGTVSDFEIDTGSDDSHPDTLDNVNDSQTDAERGIDMDLDAIDTKGDSASGVGSDSTLLPDGDSDGLPDPTDPCPEDAANACLDDDTDDHGAEPVFDFDGDGCLPSAGYDENGNQNGGLSPTGSITGGCRDENFLDSSHTLHRYHAANRKLV